MFKRNSGNKTNKNATRSILALTILLLPLFCITLVSCGKSYVEKTGHIQNNSSIANARKEPLSTQEIERVVKGLKSDWKEDDAIEIINNEDTKTQCFIDSDNVRLIITTDKKDRQSFLTFQIVFPDDSLDQAVNFKNVDFPQYMDAMCEIFDIEIDEKTAKKFSDDVKDKMIVADYQFTWRKAIGENIISTTFFSYPHGACSMTIGLINKYTEDKSRILLIRKRLSLESTEPLENHITTISQIKSENPISSDSKYIIRGQLKNIKDFNGVPSIPRQLSTEFSIPMHEKYHIGTLSDETGDMDILIPPYIFEYDYSEYKYFLILEYGDGARAFVLNIFTTSNPETIAEYAE